MGLFEGLQIALDLGYSLNFNKKTEVKRKVVENGGIISYIVTKKCNIVVTSDPEKCDVSSKCRMAVKYGLPVLKLDYIWDSLQTKTLLPYDSYVVGGKSKMLDFRSGRIASSVISEKPKKRITKAAFNPRTVRIWVSSDSSQPWQHEEHFEVAKYAIFYGYTSNGTCQCMTLIELQTPPMPGLRSRSTFGLDDSGKSTQNNYRIVLQSGSVKDLEEGKLCHKEVRYVSTADQALAVFAMLYDDIEKKGEMLKGSGPVRAVGSQKLQKLMAEVVDANSTCSDEVKELVENIWSEAMTEVTSVIGDFSAIKVEQVEKAEAVLFKVRDAIKSSCSEKKIQDLISEFYTTLPHRNENSFVQVDDQKKWLIKKQDMCQLIRDIISVSEMTNYETRAYVEAKYAALRCRITHLSGNDSDEIVDMVKSSLDESAQDITVLNVYEVWRRVEDLGYRNDLEGKRLLFHASKVENFVGILSRGLLLPKVVVDDLGGKRSDAGMLGSGIYFASSASTSVKYSSPSKTKGSRFLLINEVALGSIKDYLTHDTTLVAPPDGYDSTHGVSRKWDKTSQFENDEYVVYSVNQQRIRYLVEFTVKGDKTRLVEQDSSHSTNMICDSIENISIHDVTGVADPLLKVQPGLIGTGSQDVELRGVHIRAKLVDLAAQVVVLQEYYNNSKQSIEAKYVFPLEDTAAVCGFEAFIGDKHIVGVVKEKETAHKEYKKAISEGHGAYLMDQDEETPDVFTVSVGNLPPGACVLIKITYVAELQVEEEQISFLLPATVAPWKEASALLQSTQDELQSHKMAASKTTVQVSVEMPFDIRSLHSPTHKIRVKQTASKAFVEMMSHQKFGAGFQLLIGLAEIHVPRMWVERHSVNKEQQACMLTFYPEFESEEVTEGEVILILDTSNSMKGEPLTEAKKVALLVLHNIPQVWRFNVVNFGSDYDELFPAPKIKSEKNLQLAISFVQGSVASKGNTNVMWPLRSLFLLPSAETQRNVFLISDGHINDDELVLSYASKSSLYTRIFSFGIGSMCNSYLLKALSRISGGAFEFFSSKTKSKWEPKVKSQMSKACQPGLTSVSVEWHRYDDNLPPPVQAPQQITSLFSGSRQVVYGFVPDCTMATLTANIDGQEVSTVVSTSELSITEGLLVHRLTARAVIRDWEDGVLSRDRTKHEVAKMDLKNYIIDLSKEYSIVTQFTSFIAVEKREENEKDLPKQGPSIEELVEKENVDLLDYMGWTTLPDDDSVVVMSMISELSKSVEQQELSNTVIYKLEAVEKKYQMLREIEGACSEDVLGAAKVLVEAYQYVGDLDKAADVAETAYKEAVNKVSNLVEDSSYPQLADILLEIRDKAANIKGDIYPGRDPIPMPKLGDGKVIIKTLTGTELTIPCQASMTVSELKWKIHEMDESLLDEIRLVYRGKQLEDDQKLEDLNIGYGDTVHTLKRLRGGGKIGGRRSDRMDVVIDLMDEIHNQCGEDMILDAYAKDDYQAYDLLSTPLEEVEDEDMGFGLFDGAEQIKATKDEDMQVKKKMKMKKASLRDTFSDEDSHDIAACNLVAKYRIKGTRGFSVDEVRKEEKDQVQMEKKSEEEEVRKRWKSRSARSVMVLNADYGFMSPVEKAAQPAIKHPRALQAKSNDDLGFMMDDASPEGDASKDTTTAFRIKHKQFKVPKYSPTSPSYLPAQGSEHKRSSDHSNELDFAICEPIGMSLSGFRSQASQEPSSVRFMEAPPPQQPSVSFGEAPLLPQPSLSLWDAPFVSFEGAPPGSSVSFGEAPPESSVSFGEAPPGSSVSFEGAPPGSSVILAAAAPLTLNSQVETRKSLRKHCFASYAKPPQMCSIGAPPLLPSAKFGRAPPPPPPSAKFGRAPSTPLPSAKFRGAPPPLPSATFGGAPPPLPTATFGGTPPPLPTATFGRAPPPLLSATFGEAPPLLPSATFGEAPPPLPSAIFGGAPPPLPSATFGGAPPPLPSATFGGAPPPLPSATFGGAPPPLPSANFEETLSLLPPSVSFKRAQLSSTLFGFGAAAVQKSAQQQQAVGNSLFSATGSATPTGVLRQTAGATSSDLFGELQRSGLMKEKSQDFAVDYSASSASLEVQEDSEFLGKISVPPALPQQHRMASSFRHRRHCCMPSEAHYPSQKKSERYEADELTLSQTTSSGITCIRASGRHLAMPNIDKLLDCQTEKGSWGLKSSLDELLGIDSKECLRILMSNGLGSLGKTATEDIKQLVATVLVLFSIMELLIPEFFPIGGPSSKELPESVIKFEILDRTQLQLAESVISAIKLASKFCVQMEKKYPLIFSTLELGANWINVASAFLQPQHG